jgi:hypothetical protein
MARRRRVLLGSQLAVPALLCGVALAAQSYPDRVGDVRAGSAPDIASVTVSHTATRVTFRFRFAKAPPLRVSTRAGWIDMLLVGIDVPPLGPRPTPGGDWLGANFAAGTHGPSKTGQLVRLGKGEDPQVVRLARFTVVTRGATLTFSLPRRALGDPAWFTFTVAAAREGVADDATGGGADFAPARGTFRYTLTG